MTREDAERVLRLILNGEKALERSIHIWQQVESRSYTIQDAYHILRHHKQITDEPEFNARYGTHAVRLEGVTLSGVPTRVVLGLREVGPCSLVTICRIPRRKKK